MLFALTYYSLFDILYSFIKSLDKNLQREELIIRSSSDFVDFALLKDGKLIELHKEEEKATFKW
jgi:hypothetical protein